MIIIVDGFVFAVLGERYSLETTLPLRVSIIAIDCFALTRSNASCSSGKA